MKLNDLHDSLLLSTKLKMPAPRKNYIVRHELFEQLCRCCEMQVIYVMGAAGMGKTTLLSSFIREVELKNTAWLSLDETNDNVFSFWHYFAAAAGDFLGEEREDILSLLRSNFEVAHMENLLTLIINRLCGDEDYYMVLDDMHYIKDHTLIGTLEFFLKSMPNNFHIFMLSRENPALYLGELAVSGRLLFIDGDKLRFSHEESLHFLKDTLKLSANDEVIAQMDDFAEGWIGGLQLVAAAGEAEKKLLRAAGSNIAAEYLTREIFKSLTKEERYFLIATGILSYFDEEICVQLVSGVDFQSMIDGLMYKNLFITCIDEEAGIYRYHNILGEYLKQQFLNLPKPEQVKLRQNASKILEAKGDKEEALCHLFKAEDFEGAICLLKSMDETVETWSFIDKLPLNYLVLDISLSVQGLMYNFGNLNLTRSREICMALEEQYKNSEIQKGLHYIYQYLNEKGYNSASIDLMTLEQIEGLDLSPMTQSLLLIENANILLENKLYTQCGKFVDRALETCDGANICVDFYGISSKAQLMEEIGRLNESLSIYVRMEVLMKSATIMDSLGYNYYVGIIGVYHKRMEESNAKKALEATQRILNTGCVPSVMVQLGYEYHLAEHELLFGNAQKGAEIVYKMMDGYFHKHTLQLDRLLVNLHVHNLLTPEIEQYFMEEYKLNGEENVSLIAQLLYIRLINEKGELDEAIKQVERVLAFSRANKNQLRLVEADLLKIRILVLSDSNQKRIITNLLRESVYYAWENRILQPFFMERDILNPLLEQFNVSATGNLSDGEQQFLQDVKRLCSDKHQATSAKEILSTREFEVLGEIAKGLTNPEIAAQLCISLATVKTHIINIFGKLGVSSRLAAVEEAKRLGCIQ